MNNESSTKISFTPLVDIRKGIFCHLLEFNGTKIIVNCGIDDSFNYSLYTDEIRDIIKDADGILITSFCQSHVGAIGLFQDQKIYCTVPTAVLCKIMLDNASGKMEKIEANVNFIMIKYSQPFCISNLNIVGYNAGSVVGNVLYKISSSTNVIAIGYNINHANESYLDGIQDFFNADLLITNSVYTSIEPNTTMRRNKEFNSILSSANKKVIIVVNIARLVEVLLSIKDEVCVVSNVHFLERVKFMIEWAGKTNSELFDFSVPFVKIKQCKSDIVIIISDYGNSIYLGNLLQTIPDNNYMLVNLTDNVFKTLPVYEITYVTHIEEKKDILKNNSCSDMVEDSSSTNWYDSHDNVVLLGFQKQSFKPNRINLVSDDYGLSVSEYFDFQAESDCITNDISSNDVIETEIVSRGDVSIEVEGDVCNLSTFKGVSDLNSIKIIINKFSISNLVIVGPSDFENKALKSFVAMGSPKIKNISICQNNQEEIVIYLEHMRTNTYKLSDAIIKSHFYTIGCENILLKKILFSDGCVDIDSQSCSSNTVVSRINMLDIVKSLQSLGLFVNKLDNTLYIEEDTVISISSKGILFRSCNIKLMTLIREKLYKYLIINNN